MFERDNTTHGLLGPSGVFESAGQWKYFKIELVIEFTDGASSAARIVCGRLKTLDHDFKAN